MIEKFVPVTLLHTNDLHSHLEQTSRIAGYVKEIRGVVPADSLLVVDCGDFLDRARPETEGTRGRVNGRLIETIGYDALLLGNNEGLTYPYGEIDAFYSRLGIPVVCANFRPLHAERQASWLVPSLKVRKSGLRIGLIGLTAPFNDYYELLGWHASDPIETAAREVEKLRPDTDILVVMSHLGLRQDERLAAAVPGIDLILGAHTHHLLEKPLYAGDTAMSAAGKFGGHIGHLRLTPKPTDGRRRIAVEGGCFPMDDRERDPEADAIIETGKSEASRSMNRVVASLPKPLPCETDRESPLPVLLASAVRRFTGAEIGLVNAGQFLGGLPAGEVTEEAVHALCPSPINCCTMTLTGRELVRALEESLLPEFYKLEIRGFGFRGHRLGTLCWDGLEAEADFARPPYERLLGARIGGEPLDPMREYRVGTLDMFTFGVGYTGLKEGREIAYYLPEFIREILCRALGNAELVEDSFRPRLRMGGR